VKQHFPSRTTLVFLKRQNIEPMIGYFKTVKTRIALQTCKHPATYEASEGSILTRGWGCLI
jgi:hypothetical protein